MDIGVIDEMVRAADSVGVPPIVRPPNNDPTRSCASSTWARPGSWRRGVRLEGRRPGARGRGQVPAHRSSRPGHRARQSVGRRARGRVDQAGQRGDGHHPAHRGHRRGRGHRCDPRGGGARRHLDRPRRPVAVDGPDGPVRTSAAARRPSLAWSMPPGLPAEAPAWPWVPSTRSSHCVRSATPAWPCRPRPCSSAAGGSSSRPSRARARHGPTRWQGHRRHRGRQRHRQGRCPRLRTRGRERRRPGPDRVQGGGGRRGHRARCLPARLRLVGRGSGHRGVRRGPPPPRPAGRALQRGRRAALRRGRGGAGPGAGGVRTYLPQQRAGHVPCLQARLAADDRRRLAAAPSSSPARPPA